MVWSVRKMFTAQCFSYNKNFRNCHFKISSPTKVPKKCSKTILVN